MHEAGCMCGRQALGLYALEHLLRVLAGVLAFLCGSRHSVAAGPGPSTQHSLCMQLLLPIAIWQPQALYPTSHHPY
jgi:hypothetical protein